MIEKFESTVVVETETRDARKVWQAPHVISGTLDEAEIGGLQVNDGPTNPS